MSDDLSENKVSDIMSVLGNDLRVNILKLVFLAPRSFSELLTHLSLESTSKLSFHLNKMNFLVVKRDIDGLYELTGLGLKAYDLIDEFDSFNITKRQIKSKNFEGSKLGNNDTIRASKKSKNFTIPFLLMTLLLSVISLLIPWFLSLFVDRLIFTTWLFPIISQFIILFVCYQLKIGIYDSMKINLLCLGIYWNIIIFFGTIGITYLPIESIGLIISIIVIQLLIYVSLLVFFKYFEIPWPYPDKDKFLTRYFIIGSVSFLVSIILYLFIVIGNDFFSANFLIIEDSIQINYFYSVNFPLSTLGGMIFPAGIAYIVYIFIQPKNNNVLKILKFSVTMLFLTFVEIFILYFTYNTYSNFLFDSIILFMGTLITITIYFLNTLGIYLYLIVFNMIGSIYSEEEEKLVTELIVKREVFKISLIIPSFFLTFLIIYYTLSNIFF